MEQDFEEIVHDLWRTNRIRKTEPKRGLVWCDRCDRNIIGHGQKCSVCGFRNTSTKHQKA